MCNSTSRELWLFATFSRHNNKSIPKMTSMQEGIDASASARKILHEVLCDPRAANLFEGVELELIIDDEGM